MWLLLAVAVLVALIVFAISLRRSTELFIVEAARGRARLVRGRLPKRLFYDVCDIVERARLEAGRIRVVLDGGRPRVRVSDEVPDGVAQQLRNVVGAYQVAQIRNGNMRP
jgi:hypothetical protein